MFIVSFIIGIFGGFFVWILDALMQEWLDISVLNYYLWFLIPVGAFVIAGGAILPTYLILKWRQILPTKGLYVAVVLASLASLWLFNFFEYHSISYELDKPNQDESVSVVNISNFISFIDYLSLKYTNIEFDEITIAGIDGKIPDDMSFGLGKFGLIVPLIEIFVAILFPIWILASMDDEGYCKVCKKYYKTKIISKSGLSKELLTKLVEEIDLNLVSAKELLEYLNDIKPEKEQKLGINIKGHYCPKCFQSYVEFYVSNEDKEGDKIIVRRNDSDFIHFFAADDYKL